MYSLYKLLALSVIVLSIVYNVAAQGAALGGRCSQGGLPGVCQRRSECASASPLPIIEFRMISPCEDDGAETVVCCLETRVTPISDLTIDPEPVLPSSVESECAAIPQDQTTEKTGRKAWDKCIEYQKQLILPCQRSMTIMRQYSRRNYCMHSAGTVIVGGRVSTIDEFPHMVQLGFQLEDYVAWRCSGTLLSDWFILTAGHCTSMPIIGQIDNKIYRVSHAAVGSIQNQNQKTILDGFQVYSILKEGIIKHPDYRPPQRPHDIALLKTAKRISLSYSAVPACLDIFGGDTTNVTATGWGQTETNDYSYILQKVTLNQFSDEVCLNKSLLVARRGTFNTTIQLCYGHHTEPSDTCRGDSGGPVTIHNPRIDCMYSVIGITSYGMFWRCGVKGIPGIYTKVSYYVPWIESVVWPDTPASNTDMFEQ